MCENGNGTRLNRTPSFEQASVTRVIEFGVEPVSVLSEVRQHDTLVSRPCLYGA
jgi:hypothetical protein